jgi:hypothetical protein
VSVADLVREWARARKELASFEVDKTKPWDPLIVQALANAEMKIAKWAEEHPKEAWPG